MNGGSPNRAPDYRRASRTWLQSGTNHREDPGQMHWPKRLLLDGHSHLMLAKNSLSNSSTFKIISDTVQKKAR
jgi:hypothetical protein